MMYPRSRDFDRGIRQRRVALLAGSGALLAVFIGSNLRGADEPPPNPAPLVAKYCVQCHAGVTPMGGVNLQQLTSQTSVGEGFAIWGKVATVLEQHRMPPKGMPQPTDDERQHAARGFGPSLPAYFAKKHDGDPGRVTVRRLTSGEYAYAIQDLTGIDSTLGIDASSDSVGGEGFTNFGDVQFMQDANLERYLEAAKKVADHAVIGGGPLSFMSIPGKTGFEMSAIARIRNIYATRWLPHGVGRGRHAVRSGQIRQGVLRGVAVPASRRAGRANVTLKDLAAREGISPRSRSTSGPW